MPPNQRVIFQFFFPKQIGGQPSVPKGFGLTLKPIIAPRKRVQKRRTYAGGRLLSKRKTFAGKLDPFLALPGVAGGNKQPGQVVHGRKVFGVFRQNIAVAFFCLIKMA